MKEPDVIGPSVLMFLAIKDGKEVEAMFVSFDYGENGGEKIEKAKSNIEKMKGFIKWL